MARKSYAPPLPKPRPAEPNSDSMQSNKPAPFKPSRPLRSDEKPVHQGGDQSPVGWPVPAKKTLTRSDA